MNSGELFESYVQYIYQTLLGAEGKNITVARRADVFDNRGNCYNIDVFYELDIAGVHHRVAVECKDTRKPVGRDEAMTFAAKIQELPSTIGIFISRGGFQSGAKKFLQDHGIVHYTGDDLPHFGGVLASMISPMVLPGESAVGQPFWSLMDCRDGRITGTWRTIPDPRDPNQWRKDLEGNMAVGIFPLFYSRPHAEWFRELAHGGSPDVCVRGIEQSTLRFLMLSAHSEGWDFAICQPFLDEHLGQPQATYQTWTAVALAREYSMVDLTSQFSKVPNTP
jgi:hypothetical protein